MDRESRLFLASVGIGTAVGLFIAALTMTAPGSNSLPGPTCYGALTLGDPVKEISNNSQTFNISVQSSSGGDWGGMEIELLNQSNDVVNSSGKGWNLTIWSIDGKPTASYEVNSAPPHWIFGANSVVASGEHILLSAPASVSLGGDSLVTTGSGRCGGSTILPLP